MFATESTTSTVTAEALRRLAGSPGPCLTILLPACRPGGVGGCSSAHVRSYLQRAESQLIDLGLSEMEVADFLGPVAALAKITALDEGSHWARAIFRSKSVLETFQLMEPVEPTMTIGNCFSIREMGMEPLHPPEFYVLSVSKGGALLFRCANFSVEAVPLALGAPACIAEALGFDAPDHDLENRSSAGRAAGSMKSVRFGTSPDKQQAYLEEYYRILDPELPKLIHDGNTPLILAGVEEEAAIFRSITKYKNLAHGVISGEDIPRHLELMLKKAYWLLEEEETNRQAALAKADHESLGASRFCTDASILLEAAFTGRVAKLYLDRDAQLREDYSSRSYSAIGGEDLLNLAAIQTILHGGTVHELSTDQMPARSVAAGALRF